MFKNFDCDCATLFIISWFAFTFLQFSKSRILIHVRESNAIKHKKKFWSHEKNRMSF